jgi:hypothetical protein
MDLSHPQSHDLVEEIFISTHAEQSFAVWTSPVFRRLQSQCAAIGSIAAKIACTEAMLRRWVRQSESGRGAQ